jgi:hypothetical protein
MLFFFFTLHFVKLSLQAQLAMPMPGSATERHQSQNSPISSNILQNLFVHLYAKSKTQIILKSSKFQQVFFCSA